jgi:NADP-dependent aldehyde dehydrogenase
LAGSITLGVGQFCTQPGVIFALDDPSTDQWVIALSEQLQNAGGVMLNDTICAAYGEGVKTLQNRDGIATRTLAEVNGQTNQAGAALFEVSGEQFLKHTELMEENFGPSSLIVRCTSKDQLLQAVNAIPGQLTGTLYADDADEPEKLAAALREKVGRLLFGGVPTGVEVTHAMHHGGPWPASSDVRSTSVGTAAIYRFVRPICYQNAPQSLLPDALKDENPLKLLRMVDGQYTREAL